MQSIGGCETAIVLYHPLNENRIAGISISSLGEWAMRVISGFAGISMLLVAAQPALAVCINRGGATECTKDNQSKYAHFIRDESTAAQGPETNSQTIVPQSNASGAAAWVLTPQVPNAATVLGIPGTASACAADAVC
jgi:hypothetical protein